MGTPDVKTMTISFSISDPTIEGNRFKICYVAGQGWVYDGYQRNSYRRFHKESYGDELAKGAVMKD